MAGKKSLNCLAIFAGCGGLSLGLEEAGFNPLFVNELNKDAMEINLINRDIKYSKLRDKYHINDVKNMVLKDTYLDNLIDGLKLDYGVNVIAGSDAYS